MSDIESLPVIYKNDTPQPPHVDNQEKNEAIHHKYAFNMAKLTLNIFNATI